MIPAQEALERLRSGNRRFVSSIGADGTPLPPARRFDRQVLRYETKLREGFRRRNEPAARQPRSSLH